MDAGRYCSPEPVESMEFLRQDTQHPSNKAFLTDEQMTLPGPCSPGVFKRLKNRGLQQPEDFFSVLLERLKNLFPPPPAPST
jgi:hypothetical protein